MTVLRIVANVATPDPGLARVFWCDVIGLSELMDMGWILTLGSEGTGRAQVSFLSEGGSGTPVPDLSVEVDDLEAVFARVVAAGIEVAYGPADEPWGVRRFFVRDPFGRLINVLAHG